MELDEDFISDSDGEVVSIELDVAPSPNTSDVDLVVDPEIVNLQQQIGVTETNEIANLQQNTETNNNYSDFDEEVADLQEQVGLLTEAISVTAQDDSDSSWDPGEDYYEIENVMQPLVENEITFPIQNYANDIEHEDDWAHGYKWTEFDDECPWLCSFEGSQSIMLDTSVQNKPEDFLNALFDNSMWATLADETNRYARQKLYESRGRRDVIDATSVNSRKKYCRLNDHKDVNEDDIKMFLAHLIVLGLVNKPRIEKYWSKDELIETPFFGKYLSRNCFQRLLSTLHLVDNESVVQEDRLYKVRPFMEMLQRNFKFLYHPSQQISLDEATCAYKGRVKFKVTCLRTHKKTNLFGFFVMCQFLV